MKKRKRYSPEFKARVALEAIREDESVSVIAQRHSLHPNQIYKWKREAVDNLNIVFEPKKRKAPEQRESELLQKIGELTVEIDFLARGLERFPRK